MFNLYIQFVQLKSIYLFQIIILHLKNPIIFISLLYYNILVCAQNIHIYIICVSTDILLLIIFLL